MANTAAANVRIIDTTATISDATRIKSIKYIAGTGSPSVTIKKKDSSGTVLYEEDSATDVSDEIEINSPLGIHVTLAGTGTKVYLYLKP